MWEIAAIIAAIIAVLFLLLLLFCICRVSGRHSRPEDAGELERAIIRAASDPASRKRG
jgi:uncharacterized membrane protein